MASPSKRPTPKPKSLADRWIYAAAVDDVRNPASFPRHSDPLPDPQGVIAQWIEATSIVPLSALEWRCQKGWHVGPRTLSDSMWFWFLNASGTVALKDRTFRFGPKDLILIPSGCLHTVRLDHEEGRREISVHFHAYVYGNINLLELVGFPFHVPFSPEAPFGAISEKLTRLFAVKGTGWSPLMSAHILELLIYLAHNHGRLFITGERGVANERLSRLLPVLRCVEDRLADTSLTVADLAREISVSEVHLRKLFRLAVGLSPVSFLQRRRVQRACRQLRQTELNVKQIAEANGFNDIVFFYRVFKHWTQMTPVAYREARRT